MVGLVDRVLPAKLADHVPELSRALAADLLEWHQDHPAELFVGARAKQSRVLMSVPAFGCLLCVVVGGEGISGHAVGACDRLYAVVADLTRFENHAAIDQWLERVMAFLDLLIPEFN